MVPESPSARTSTTEDLLDIPAFMRYGVSRSAISVTAVRANQLPRVVSRADALPWRMLNISIPSRPRSATVTPETGLSSVLADDALQAPSCL